ASLAAASLGHRLYVRWYPDGLDPAAFRRRSVASCLLLSRRYLGERLRHPRSAHPKRVCPMKNSPNNLPEDVAGAIALVKRASRRYADRLITSVCLGMGGVITLLAGLTTIRQGGLWSPAFLLGALICGVLGTLLLPRAPRRAVDALRNL